MKFFDSIQINRPKRSKFDLSHENKLTLNMGELIPILVQEIIPGDSFKAQSEIIARFAPMIAPMYQRINISTHYFFVPNRLVWNEWEQFITGGEEGTAQPVAPYFDTLANVGLDLKAGSLADYMGMPSNQAGTGATINQKISSIPFRAYQMIYNEYYRDQNLCPKIVYPITSGAETAGNAQIIATKRQRAWEKDYFTSALPWAQKGGAVTLPWEYKDRSDVIMTDTGLPAGNGPLTANVAGQLEAISGAVGAARLENIDTLSSINDIRRASALQRWLEKMARGGSRYAELLLHMFGEKSDDARLQRPEYLGGGIQPVSISEVLSTYDNTANDLPQGNMSGHGISVGGTNGFTSKFKEHGYIIGIMSILPKTGYMQGLPRHLQRFDRFDYAWPDFANIGEQELKNKEVFLDWADAQPDADTWPEQTFGYQSRYAEYKFGMNTTHGDFRTSLAFWHEDRIFGSRPALNEQFVKSDPSNRIFAVQDPDIHHVWVNIYNRISAIRPLPYHGTPTLY
ncbi:MAG: major capsid protein [Microviridae sp.]|nr:MAG: major capsid protein [Microviridae sp.]